MYNLTSFRTSENFLQRQRLKRQDMACCADLMEEEVHACLKKLGFLGKVGPSAFSGGDLGDFAVWTIHKLVFKLRFEHRPNKLGEQT